MPRILAIENDPSRQRVVRAAFEPACDVRFVSDAAEALVAARQHIFDLLVCTARERTVPVTTLVDRMLGLVAPRRLPVLLLCRDVVHDRPVIADLVTRVPVLTLDREPDRQRLQDAGTALMTGPMDAGGLGGGQLLSALLAIEQKADTGMLHVWSGNRERTCLFANGRLVLAADPDLGDRTGATLVRFGISPTLAVGALAADDPEPGAMNELLEELLEPRRRALVPLLRRRSRENVQDMITWAPGTWQYRSGTEAGLRVPSGLPTGLSSFLRMQSHVGESDSPEELLEDAWGQDTEGVECDPLFTPSCTIFNPGGGWQPDPVYRIRFRDGDAFQGAWLHQLRHQRIFVSDIEGQLDQTVRLRIEVPAGGDVVPVQLPARVVSIRRATAQLPGGVGFEIDYFPPADRALMDAAFKEALRSEDLLLEDASEALLESAERRVFERAALDESVLLGSGSHSRRARAIDIAEGGLAVGCMEPLTPTTPVDVTFSLPQRPPIFQVQSRVVWSRRVTVGGSWIAGCAFTNLSDRDRARIRSWVEEQLP